MQQLDAIGSPVRIVCPDCGGAMWRLDGSSPPRFRCHTGHAFTLRSLDHANQLGTGEAMWTALRALQEREQVLRLMARSLRGDSDVDQAQHLEAQAAAVAAQAQQLRRLVVAE